MKLGLTFPDKDFQLVSIKQLASNFRETPWMISVDAAGEHTPFAKDTMLSEVQFGLFDNSFTERLTLHQSTTVRQSGEVRREA